MYNKSIFWAAISQGLVCVDDTFLASSVRHFLGCGYGSDTLILFIRLTPRKEA